MHKTRKQVKEAMMRAMEAEVDALMEWLDATPTPNLTEIEEQVIRLREVVSAKTTAAVLEGQVACDPLEAHCPGCGGVAIPKGLKKLGIQSSCAALDVDRSYWYCPSCKKGFFPPR
jgi:hypothetical protein